MFNKNIYFSIIIRSLSLQFPKKQKKKQHSTNICKKQLYIPYPLIPHYG